MDGIEKKPFIDKECNVEVSENRYRELCFSNEDELDKEYSNKLRNDNEVKDEDNSENKYDEGIKDESVYLENNQNEFDNDSASLEALLKDVAKIDPSFGDEKDKLSQRSKELMNITTTHSENYENDNEFCNHNLSVSESIFEIEDFTTVTATEKLAAQFDFILRKHKISRINQEGCIKRVYISDKIEWAKEDDVIEYMKDNLTISFTYLSSFPTPLNDAPILVDEESGKEYFEIDLRNVTSYYGDKEINNDNVMTFAKAFGIFGFIWIGSQYTQQKIIDWIDIKHILSSLGAFDREYGSCVPVFCSTGFEEPWCGQGIALEGNKRVDFEQACLSSPPHYLRYLNGLKELFVDKINNSSNYPLDVTATIKTRYVILRKENFGNRFKFGQYDVNEYDDDSIRYVVENNKFLEELKKYHNTFNVTPFRYAIEEVRLYSEWTNLSTDLINEGPLFSDLDPKLTSKWSLEVIFNEDSNSFFYDTFSVLADCHTKHKNAVKIPNWYFKEKLVQKNPYEYQYDYILDTTGISHNTLVENEIYMKYYKYSDDESFNSTKRILSILPQQIVEYVFESFDDSKNFAKDISQMTSCDEEFEKIGNWKNYLLEEFEKFKSSKPRTLTEIISVVIAKCINTSYQDSYKLAAYVWMEFINMLGKYFDEAKDLPGIERNQEPSFDDCRLHQLLQLLQCCIDAKKQWHDYYDNENFNNHDYDEFHDAEEEFQNIQTDSFKDFSSEVKPVGRSHPVPGNLRLLNYDDRIMYIPFLQYPAPLTEEQFHNKILLESDLSNEERLQNQIVGLKSDMSAFKAANPGCCFEDFVRWHSPNDWILNEENGTYNLSQRMADSDNIWQSTWNAAPALPITEQDHIFNETVEAYKVLETLKDVNVSQLLSFIMPSLITVGFKTLVEKVHLKDKFSQESLYALQRYLLCQSAKDSETEVLFTFAKNVKKIQNRIFYYEFLKETFAKNSVSCPNDDQNECIDDLILKLIRRDQIPVVDEDYSEFDFYGPTVSVLGGPMGFIGEILCSMAKSMTDVNELTGFPEPELKEYILKCSCSRPFKNSRICNNRMYSKVESDCVSWYLSMSSDIASA
uniref:Rab3 GTPase-activating protein catalytic subunit n=1 Tax=Parastrongyloides trichosuri TaxID=131310 RepID=A0A0N4Z7U4_PARTI